MLQPCAFIQQSKTNHSELLNIKSEIEHQDQQLDQLLLHLSQLQQNISSLDENILFFHEQADRNVLQLQNLYEKEMIMEKQIETVEEVLEDRKRLITVQFKERIKLLELRISKWKDLERKKYRSLFLLLGLIVALLVFIVRPFYRLLFG